MIDFNKIYCMDCLKGMKLINSESIDLIVTDPPYLINYKSNHRKDKNHDFCKVIDNDNNPELIKNFIKESYRVLKHDSAFYCFCSFDKVDFFKKEIEKYFNLKNMIIWIKNNWTAGDLEAQFGKQYEIILLANKGRKKINGKRISDVWTFDKVYSEKALHQNQKPVYLINRCLEKHSKKNDIVLDPFLGSGTTAVACKHLRRRYIGFEICENYFNIARDRLDKVSRPLETFF